MAGHVWGGDDDGASRKKHAPAKIGLCKRARHAKTRAKMGGLSFGVWEGVWVYIAFVCSRSLSLSLCSAFILTINIHT